MKSVHLLVAVSEYVRWVCCLLLYRVVVWSFCHVSHSTSTKCSVMVSLTVQLDIFVICFISSYFHWCHMLASVSVTRMMLWLVLACCTYSYAVWDLCVIFIYAYALAVLLAGEYECCWLVCCRRVLSTASRGWQAATGCTGEPRGTSSKEAWPV